MSATLVALAIPLFLAGMALELAVGRRRGLQLYRLPDSLASLGSGIGQQVIGAFTFPITVGAYAFAHDRLGLFHLSARSPWTWVLAFFAVDLAYYAFHRASHRVNFFWASHIVHHQSEEYNLSTALRQSWFGQLSAWVFYIPLAVAGIPTAVFLTMSTLNTLYQFWIHTRTVSRLGPLEHVLNTPSHHRVHHGVNPEYIDKNYAGILIIWDKLFGTFEPERAEPAYGLVKPLGSFNPLWANVHYWVEMARLSRAGRTLGERLYAWIAPPEWKPAALGGPVHAPPVDARTRPKFDVDVPARLAAALLVWFVVIVAASTIYIAGGPAAPLERQLPLGAWILTSTIGWGLVLAYLPSSSRILPARSAAAASAS